MSRALLFAVSASALGLLTTTLFAAEEASEKPAAADKPVIAGEPASSSEPVVADGPAHPHGSGRGQGNSRGPGRGDGTGWKGPGTRPSQRRAKPAAPSAPPIPSLLERIDIVPNAQYRVRYRHHEGHDFVSGGVADTFRHRARLGLQASYDKMVGVMAQLQDVRAYGEESDLVKDVSADGLDMHQAYAFFKPIDSIELRFGRQEIGFANERLVGKLDWAESARSFDGARFTFNAANTRVDTFWALARDRSVNTSAFGSEGGKQHVVGWHFGHEMMDELKPSVLGVFDLDTDSGRRMITLGGLFAGELGGMLRYGLEGYYQGGSHDEETSHTAYLVAANLRATFDVSSKPYIDLDAAFLSGDDNTNDTTVKTFELPYPTGHKFHGEMDMFLNMRPDTQQRGLRDIATSIGASPLKGLSLEATHHLFQAMEKRGDLEHFGHELDLKAQLKFLEYARAAVLYSAFFPGNLKQNEALTAYKAEAETEHFAYTTLEVSF